MSYIVDYTGKDYNFFSFWKFNTVNGFIVTLLNSMKIPFIILALVVFTCLLPRASAAHSLPSHFKEHSHTEPKFERPNFRVRRTNSTN